METFYSIHQTKSSSFSAIESVIVSVVPSVLGCDGAWSALPSGIGDSRSESALSICKDVATSFDNYRKLSFSYGSEIEDCALNAAACLSSICTRVTLPRMPLPLHPHESLLHPRPTKTSFSPYLWSRVPLLPSSLSILLKNDRSM